MWCSFHKGHLSVHNRVKHSQTEPRNFTITLLLIMTDAITYETVKTNIRRIRWNLMKGLDDTEHADDVYLFSINTQNVLSKIHDLVTEVSKIGLNINENKTKQLKFNRKKIVKNYE